jgi:hypothetical protein
MNTTNLTDMKHTTRTAIAIDTAARTGSGDARATERALARFCTESLIDAAESCVAGMSQDHRERFCSSITTYTRWTRELAIWTLCGWVSCQRVIEFGETLRAASAEFAAAYEAIGAAL